MKDENEDNKKAILKNHHKYLPLLPRNAVKEWMWPSLRPFPATFVKRAETRCRHDRKEENSTKRGRLPRRVQGSYRLRFLFLSAAVDAIAIGAAGRSEGCVGLRMSSFLMGTPMWRP